MAEIARIVTILSNVNPS